MQNLSACTQLSTFLTAGMLLGMVGPLTSTLSDNVLVETGGQHGSVTVYNLAKSRWQYGKGHSVLKSKEFSCMLANYAMLSPALTPRE